MPRCLALLLLTTLSFAQGSPEWQVPKAAWREFDEAAERLAKAGNAKELEVLLGLLGELGRTPRELEKVRSSSAKDLAKAKPKERDSHLDKARKALDAGVALLVPLLDGLGERPREELASLLLSFDSDSEPAHARLGHVLHEGRWMWPEEQTALARRTEIANAVQRAHRLEVEIVTGRARIPLFDELYGKEAVTATYGPVSIASVLLSEQKLVRILRQTLRALALSHWMRTGVLAVPELHGRSIAALGSKADYDRSIAVAAKKGWLAASRVEPCRALSAYFTDAGDLIHTAQIEAGTQASLVFQLFPMRTQPWIEAGHINWLCHAFLGTRGPSVVWTDSQGPFEGTVDEATKREWKEMVRLGEAGLAGSRAYMRWLVERGLEPALVDCMLDQFGKIRGEPLLKATTAIEFLQEDGRFSALFESTRSVTTNQAPAATAAALGQTLDAFEASWRRWLLPPRGLGLLQRLRGEIADTEPPKEAKDAVGYLQQLRNMAHVHKPTVPLRWDPELSKGCRAHAVYLGLNRAQLAAWPDAHEEYPDRSGFSPEGSLAGLASVISPGSAGWRDAIDGWMGTFYHRLPLLDPGLMRVGWALVDRVAVLDVGSMVAPAEWVATVVWPAPGAKGVPRRFVPELPNPFPGRDQARLGYPVTVQLFHVEVVPGSTLDLYKGATVDPAARVAGLVSSPEAPGNLELVPDMAWLFAPETELEPRTRYTAVFTRTGEAKPYVWSFETGD